MVEDLTAWATFPSHIQSHQCNIPGSISHQDSELQLFGFLEQSYYPSIQEFWRLDHFIKRQQLTNILSWLEGWNISSEQGIRLLQQLQGGAK